MKVFVVSLKRSVDRRERIQKHLDALNISFEFFDAIDGSVKNFQYSDHGRPVTTKKRKGYSLKTSEIACFASHYAMWQKCVSLNEPIVIMEDNVDPIANAKQIIELSFEHIQTYDYIKLSATHKSPFHRILDLTPEFQLGGYKKKTCGTTAYIISPKAAQRFIDNAQAFLEPVDDYMEKPWRHQVQIYSVSPDLFTRADITSTIGSTRKDKSGISPFNKIYIELFRTYESLMKSLHWKNK
ncbi:glycosyltransferase [Aliivibrio fischeri]|uniref:glycosyltransferase family 25 protein n=1 Tax=Aliivibrio fischeri TaxID=668 RepID=UPI0012D87242|nr:glycosyltransferase family 25 protein [Aliivibrio fischeri]MUK77076.1 glycosyltransferase [Aliivibrio fischeri]